MLTEPDDATATSAEGAKPENHRKDRSAELLEQLGSELSRLAICQAELKTARHSAEVKRTVRDLAASALIATAFLAAFAFLNVAAFGGLSTNLSTWLSALVLAVFWLVVGALGSVAVVRHVRGSPLWWIATTRPAEAIEELERQRAEAHQAVRATLEQVVPAVSIEVATAAIPSASGIAGGVVGAGEGLLEASDEIVEEVVDEIPGGGVVNQIRGVVLVPGRFGLRVATTVLKRPPPAG